MEKMTQKERLDYLVEEFKADSVQYRDLATGKAKTGTFFAGDRAVEKYANGLYKEISVTLTEV